MPKRKEAAASAAAMSGTFTRSRSEIFLHRTRSGRARPGPKLRHPAPIPPLNVPPLNSVKDLRLKRVFSVHEAKIVADEDRVDTKSSGSDELEFSRGASDDSGEDSMETATPPELDGGKGVMASEKGNLGDSLPENKVEISPCSRSKLIENPTSISYRRLLPYLKDLAKDVSSGIEIVQSKHCLPKAEKPTIEKPVPACEEQSHVVPLEAFPMANSSGNNDSNGSPVLENLSVNSDEETVHKAIKVESLNPRNESKVPTPQVISEVVFSENNMDVLNRQEQKGPNDKTDESVAEILKVPDDCSGGSVQSTPPDTGFANKVDGTELGSRRTISQPALNNTTQNNLGLVSCSRSKVYRNPSFFSYRRLLPYLMDLAKNGSSGLEIVDSHSCTAKVENSIEERPSMLNDVPSPRQQHHTVSLEGPSPVRSRENEDSEMHVVSQSPGLDFQADSQNPLIIELPNSCDKSEVELLGNTTEVPLERSDFELEMLSKSSSFSPTSPEDLSFEELSGNVLGLPHSPMETDTRPNKTVSEFEAFSHANRALAPRKGILKKQSRRCKGICMCLDCVSFRIHAERAYEFSRRQMSDAHEVVEQVKNELSCLRNLMETSVVPMVAGAGNYTVLQVCQEQLKGACQRAFKLEEQAKSRMWQMFGDLNAHCRIPGSRLAFSNSIHERNIP